MSEPDVIGRYIIEKEIGRGGMSFVYLARDPYMKRRVAIKALPSHYAGDPNFLQRFRRTPRSSLFTILASTRDSPTSSCALCRAAPSLTA